METSKTRPLPANPTGGPRGSWRDSSIPSSKQVSAMIGIATLDEPQRIAESDMEQVPIEMDGPNLLKTSKNHISEVDKAKVFKPQPTSKPLERGKAAMAFNATGLS